MKRDITKNPDGTFKVNESNVVESVTKEQLVLFRNKLREDIKRLKSQLEDIEVQEKQISELLG